ncbi:hypothetical protein A2U01_0088254, partial [Trifolium medium]|nr:hypothetical protein [Trifolium medium]
MSTTPSLLRWGTTENKYRLTTPTIQETVVKPLSPPQSTQEIPVDRAQPSALITREDIANLITALRSTNETLQQQGLR